MYDVFIHWWLNYSQYIIEFDVKSLMQMAIEGIEKYNEDCTFSARNYILYIILLLYCPMYVLVWNIVFKCINGVDDSNNSSKNWYLKRLK